MSDATPLDRAALLEAVNELLGLALSVLGTRAPASTRWHAYAEALRADPPAVDPDLLHEAHLECLDLQPALVALRMCPPEQQRALLLEVLGGQTLAHRDRPEARARNTMWELSVAGLLAQSGGLTVSLAEPDVVAEGPGVSLHVACKRLRSGEQYGKRIREAVSQIRRRSLRSDQLGVIVMDVSRIIVQDDTERLRNFRAPQRVTDENWAKAINDNMRSNIANEQDTLRAAIDAGFGGVILRAFHVSRVDNEFTYTSAALSGWFINDERKAPADAYLKRALT